MKHAISHASLLQSFEKKKKKAVTKESTYQDLRQRVIGNINELGGMELGNHELCSRLALAPVSHFVFFAPLST